MPYIQQAKPRNPPALNVLDRERDKYGGLRVRDQGGVYTKANFQALSDRVWYLRILSSEMGFGNDMNMW